MNSFESRLKAFSLDQKTERILRGFYESYIKSVKNPAQYEGVFIEMMEYVANELKNPTRFDLFHSKEASYYEFGLNFIRPLIDEVHSGILGEEYLEKIEEQINRGENVILLANHQTEPDPQIISCLLEKEYPKLAEDIIAVAGHRVVSDPFAIPFSRGRNLLCIYSKRYIENPPEEKAEKQLHNQRTLNRMKELLKEGGKLIYVAPSGGRDRMNDQKEIMLAPFDANSIELFKIYADQAKTKTHFYPLALSTYRLLPPPENIQTELGEMRLASFQPVHLAFGEEIDMSRIPGSEGMDKKQMREKRASNIWSTVNQLYGKIHA